MRALLAIVTLLLAGGVAQAQYTIEYEGHTIRIDPDRGTVSIPGVYDTTGKKTKRARTNPDSSQKQAPAPQQPTTADRQPSSDGPAKAPVQDAQTPAPTAQPSVPAYAAPAATATNTPVKNGAAPAPPAPIQQGGAPITPSASPAPSVAAAPPAPAPSTAAPVARPQTPAPTTATAPSAPLPSPSPAPRARVPSTTVATVAPAPPAPDPNSPVGIWLTEEKEGKIRIEPCGDSLCGYAVDSKSNANAEQVLINMKPAKDQNKDQNKDQQWSGRIHDPNTGSNYDSTIALKGKDELRVQGCAFGGMFCGGQTWTRVN